MRSDTLPAALDSLKEWGEYYDGARPVAYTVDLNGDTKPEWMVRSDASLCGRAGCPTRIIARTADGRFIELLDGLMQGVYVTGRHHNGWPVLWIAVGARDGGIYRMEFRGNRYEPAGTLRKTSDTEEWTTEQAQQDTLFQQMSAASER